MAPLPQKKDPTLAAIDAALVAAQQSRYRPYLGMSEIGHDCERKLFYSFRWAARPSFDAATLKRFADGHAGEDVQADRLKMVDGITLHTEDPQTGGQFGFTDIKGHFKGHMDGAIHGLLQAPATWHVWEHKQVGEKSITKLEKIKRELGEKDALKVWNPTYYAQAVLYMDYSGMDRHYLTAANPGGRDTVSCRTNADKEHADRLKAKASRVINAEDVPQKLSEKPDYFQCRWCDFSDICHNGAWADKSCRTCIHSTPTDNGKWHCGKFDRTLGTAEQTQPCNHHLTLPGLVPGEQIDAGDNWISYKMPDGSEWIDQAEGGDAHV